MSATELPELAGIAGAVFAAGTAAAKPFTIEHLLEPGVEGVLLPPGFTVQTFERFMSNPLRAHARIELHDEASLVAYAKRFGISPETVILMDLSVPALQVVVDYHRGPGNDGKLPLPGWADHRATLTLTPSPEWAEWTADNEKWMPPDQFAIMIEDRIDDIVTPDGAALAEMVRDFRATKSGKFANKVDELSGSVKLEFLEEIDGRLVKANGQTMKFPGELAFACRPFMGAEAYKMRARLRFRVASDATLAMSYRLVRAGRAWTDAAELLAARVTKALPEFRTFAAACLK